LGYRGEKKYDDILSRFHAIPERNGQTDGRTDRRTDGQSDLLYQYRALVCLRAIKIDWKNKTKTFSELKEIPVVITGNYFLGFTLERICETGSILRDKSGRQMPKRTVSLVSCTFFVQSISVLLVQINSMTSYAFVLQDTENFIDFYRATHMHSADYAMARCPSVCPSHAGIVCKQSYVTYRQGFYTIG